MSQKWRNIYGARDTRTYRKVAGFWKIHKRRGDPFAYLKCSSITQEGIDNMTAFGDNTCLMLMPNKRKRSKDSPDYNLVATEKWFSRDKTTYPIIKAPEIPEQ